MAINAIDTSVKINTISPVATQDITKQQDNLIQKDASSTTSSLETPAYDLDISAAGYEMSRNIAREMTLAQKIGAEALKNDGFVINGSNNNSGNIDNFPINTRNSSLDIVNFYGNDAEQLMIDSGLEGGSGSSNGISGNDTRNPINTANTSRDIFDFYANDNEQLLTDSGLEGGSGSGSATNSYALPINTRSTGVDVTNFMGNDDEQLLNNSGLNGNNSSGTSVNSYNNPINTNNAALNVVNFNANDDEQLLNNSGLNGGGEYSDYLTPSPNAVQSPINTNNATLNVVDFNGNEAEQLLAATNLGPQGAYINQQTFVNNANIPQQDTNKINTVQGEYGLNLQDGYGTQSTSSTQTRDNLMAANNDINNAARQSATQSVKGPGVGSEELSNNLTSALNTVEADINEDVKPFSDSPMTAKTGVGQGATAAMMNDLTQLNTDLQTALSKPGFVDMNASLVQRATEAYNYQKGLI